MMEKRVAIVTGGTRGMGKDISVALAKTGEITVFAIYRSNKESALQTKTELQAIDPASDIIAGDVAKAADVKRMIEEVVQKCGRIDILVNNAGIFDFAFIEDLTEEYFDHVMNVNMKSQLLMMQAVLPYMKKQAYGRILNASSISGALADVGLVAYGASKAAVNMLTTIAAGEFAPYNITVNAYAPGIIYTDMTADMIRERGEQQAKQVALNRFGTGDEIASLIVYLVSEAAGYVTGEIIGMDGGFFKVQNPQRAHEYVQAKEN